ncbi:hypothetical protein OFM81_31885, partial [Escherichia coli]|nr:hypothetical protein [Escherichia coli]
MLEFVWISLHGKVATVWQLHHHTWNVQQSEPSGCPNQSLNRNVHVQTGVENMLALRAPEVHHALLTGRDSA